MAPPRPAGLRRHLHTVASLQAGEEVQKALRLIAGAGDVVSASQIDPFQFREPGAEFGLEGVQGPLQIIGVLLTEGVEVKPV